MVGCIGMEGDFLGGESMGVEDRLLAERQLGRSLRGEVRVASRCPHGKVQVIATSPLLEDGTPFPTLYWLTCPLLRSGVSRLENGDLREELRRRVEEDGDFSASLLQAEREYRRRQEDWAERMGVAARFRELFSQSPGIGGTVSLGLKCLHAHLAHYLAGGSNPVGREVMARLGEVQRSECGGDCGPFLRRKR